MPPSDQSGKEKAEKKKITTCEKWGRVIDKDGHKDGGKDGGWTDGMLKKNFFLRCSVYTWPEK